MVDRHASGACARKSVRVQISPPAPQARVAEWYTRTPKERVEKSVQVQLLSRAHVRARHLRFVPIESELLRFLSALPTKNCYTIFERRKDETISKKRKRFAESEIIFDAVA